MTATRVMGTATKLAGTPGFQSPEQLKGETISISADIYALGAVLTEQFSGKPIWSNMSSPTIILKVMWRYQVANQYGPICLATPLSWKLHVKLPDLIRNIAKRCLSLEKDRMIAKEVMQAICEVTETAISSVHPSHSRCPFHWICDKPEMISVYTVYSKF